MTLAVDPVLGSLIGVASLLTVVVVLMGAGWYRSRKLLKQHALSSVQGLHIPPLIMPGDKTILSPVQPRPESFIGSIFNKTPEILVDPPVCSDKPSRGKINFSLAYREETETLLVHLMEAVDLPARDLFGTSDPYVRIFLLPEIHDVKVTKIHRKMLCPKFNQTLEFGGHSVKKLQDMSLCLQVMDYDRFKSDDAIGEIIVPLRSVKFDNTPIYWKQLQKPSVHTKQEPKGELLLSLCWLPDSRRLSIVIIKAKDLPVKDVTGSSDPYVKLWLVNQGSRVEKRKTTVKYQTLNPLYNESFVFSVLPEKITDLNLYITVMDYDFLSSNDEIGHLVIGERGQDSGQRHWREVQERPGYPVAMWHKLTPRW